MKSFLILLFLLFSLKELKAQYTVIRISGNVEYDNKKIARNLVFDKIAQLTFSGLKDTLVVIKKGAGLKYLVKANKPHGGSILEFTAYSLGLTAYQGTFSGRGDLNEKIPVALQPAPNSNGKIIIEQENKFLFDPNEFPQTNGAFFFVQTNVPDQKPVTHKLKTMGDTLIMSYADLVTGPVNPAAKYKIGYRDANGNTHLVTTIDPYFDNTNETEGMIAGAVAAYKTENLKKEAVRDSVYSVVYLNSGKPNGISFTRLFNQYWLSTAVK